MSSWIEIIRTALATIIGIGLGGFVIWTSLKDKASKYAFGGEVHAFLGHDETATLRYRKVLEFDLGHFDALYFMGARHAAEREFPQVVSCYERYLRQRPNNPNVLFKILADEYFLKNFRWHEEGFGPSWKSALFLTACMVEFLLLASFFL